MATNDNRAMVVEAAAVVFGDKDHPCCEGFNCYVCVAHFALEQIALAVAVERTRVGDELERLCDVSFWKDDMLDLTALTQYRKDMDGYIDKLRAERANDGSEE